MSSVNLLLTKVITYQLSEVLQVEVTGELSDAYEQINGYGHELNPLHIQSENNLINYEEFVKKRKK